jgi:hypothetical protein
MFKMTPITIAIHKENDSPVFGETATHISLEDSGAGCFLKITQFPDTSASNEINLEFEELELLTQAAEKLRENLKED